MRQLKITEAALVDCSTFNNGYHQNSRAIHTFVPNKSFGQLLDISSTNFIF